MNKTILIQIISAVIILLLVSIFLDFLIVGEIIRYDVLGVLFLYLVSVYCVISEFKVKKTRKPKVEVLKCGDDKLPLPTYTTPGSAGLDLRADFLNSPNVVDNSVVIQPGETFMVGTGISIFINDPSLVAVAVPRSGLSIKNGVGLKNFIGVIDSDYQNEISLALWNHGDKPYTLTHGDRVAQLLFIPVVQPELVLVDSFSEATERGLNGWGHSGTK